MLTIIVPNSEFYDDTNEVFVYSKEHTLQLEHSLVSLSKWESIWQKPFLTNKEKTKEEISDYIRCMTLTQNVDPNIYKVLTKENIKDVGRYIENPMTATTFSKMDKQITKREIITAEIIYYWMIALNVPFECQKWHLNRLLTLINVCNIKNQPAGKMPKNDVLKRNKALNAARRSKYNTKG